MIRPLHQGHMIELAGGNSNIERHGNYLAVYVRITVKQGRIGENRFDRLRAQAPRTLVVTSNSRGKHHAVRFFIGQRRQG